jgi:hypothetical protein
MKDIYGCVSDCNSAKILMPEYVSAIKNQFINVTKQIHLVLDTLIMKNVKTTGFIGEIAGRSTANAVIIVYMTWTRMHPGTKFDVDSIYHRNQVKDIYLNMGIGWSEDPIIGTDCKGETKAAPTAKKVAKITRTTAAAAPINTTPL